MSFANRKIYVTEEAHRAALAHCLRHDIHTKAWVSELILKAAPLPPPVDLKK